MRMNELGFATQVNQFLKAFQKGTRISSDGLTKRGTPCKKSKGAII